MNRPPYDVVLVGGGLANGLIGLRLLRAFATLRILILEKAPVLNGEEHTWSFHQSDIHPDDFPFLVPLVSKSWSGYDVAFPQLKRGFSSGYHTILSSRFYDVLQSRFGESLRLNCDVAALEPGRVRLSTGEWIEGKVIVDGRGWRAIPPGMELGFQKFYGITFKLNEPHGLTRPLLMDVECEQVDGFRFFYCLPWSDREVLVEDTHYSDTPGFDVETYRKEIFRYVEKRGWSIAAAEREERGSLPIPLNGSVEPWPEGIICSGMRAGLFQATTGYSLPEAVRYARHFVENYERGPGPLRTELQKRAVRGGDRRRFLRLLNRMLFRASEPEKRYKILQRFYGLPEQLIQHFYAGRLTLGDRIRILAGRPPVPIGRALKCFFESTETR